MQQTSIKSGNKSTPYLSIIMPAYREENQIRDALDSTLRQDGPSFEVIVGVEAEDRQTTEIIREYGSRYECIRLESFLERVSVSEKINRMLEVCRGEIIIKMDADMIWGHDQCFVKLKAYYENENVGGVSLAGDRGLSGYGEIFQYVKDPGIRSLIIMERNKSFSGRGEQFLGRIVNKFRESLFPIKGKPKHPVDIHCFRRHLVDALDPALIHDDAQFALQVLDKGYTVVYGREVILHHAGIPASTQALFRQKLKGHRGWAALKRQYPINMRKYYAALLLFILKNFYRFNPVDSIALLYWIAVFITSKVYFRFKRDREESLTWESPRS